VSEFFATSRSFGRKFSILAKVDYDAKKGGVESVGIMNADCIKPQLAPHLGLFAGQFSAFWC